MLRHRLCQRVVERGERLQPAPFKNITRGTNDTTSPSPSSHSNALTTAGAATPAWVPQPPPAPHAHFLPKENNLQYIYIYTYMCDFFFPFLETNGLLK